MKCIANRILPMFLMILSLSAIAQINSGVGYMHGTTHKGDTGTKSTYVDDPREHGHTDTVTIRRVPTPASEAKAETRERRAAGQQDTTAMDTLVTNTTPVDTTVPVTTATTTAMTGLLGASCIDMNLIYTAIAVFGLAAIIGMYLIMLLMRDQKRPLFVVVIHGLFATAALTLFIVYCVYQPGPLASLTIFCIAALCGLVLIYNEVTGRPVPKWLGALQGALAFTGFVLLLIFAFAH